jgi:hypothetical protein
LLCPLCRGNDNNNKGGQKTSQPNKGKEKKRKKNDSNAKPGADKKAKPNTPSQKGPSPAQPRPNAPDLSTTIGFSVGAQGLTEKLLSLDSGVSIKVQPSVDDLTKPV